MVYEINLNATFGEVVGYFQRLNPFSTMAKMTVRVNNRTLRIPVDRRQVKFMEKEYPVGSMVVLEYDGHWSVRSRKAPGEYVLNGMPQSVYY